MKSEELTIYSEGRNKKICEAHINDDNEKFIFMTADYGLLRRDDALAMARWVLEQYKDKV
jgi:hypothetical protein